MTEITIKGKKKLKKSSTLSMHVEQEILRKFRSKCIDEFGISHTDVIRNFIERVVIGKITLNVEE